ncbi:non-ribosomal peptide synthetase [Enhygromyxa salina]|uniref:non-ribosomal peptide synthetase n=1 Tax=Enhygromyxa salina TaxID=215803 RepID=UPI0015E5CE56|nr:non-ribosomal peptide synthetase [Enhygromyxa salina]
MVSVLRNHAARTPDAVAYTFLTATGPIELRWSELDARARAVAAELQAEGEVIGERVVILEPTSPEFVVAFFAALYAGAIAMPLAPPRDPRGLERTVPVLRSGRPRVGLISARLQPEVEALARRFEEFRGIRWRSTTRSQERGQGWRPPAADPDRLALLQYTSGSTGRPRGVAVSDANLRHNLAMMRDAFATTRDSTIVCWLPMFHDMGLIGNMLHGLFLGCHSVLFSPRAFLDKPVRWLEAIARHGADFSGAPNFAYEMCARKVSASEAAELDLSSWRVAFNGAEPVRDQTLVRFSERFAASGFRAEAWFPCYGLAEATLFVSGGDHRARARRCSAPGDAERVLVSCGHAWSEQEIAIVEPEARERVAEGEVGEIWLRGASVAQGYYGAASVETFAARLADDDGPFLRTGDLGFLRGGELYIVGRRKDLIIIRGRNHYPQDIEYTSERSHAALRVGCCAAFTAGDELGEGVVVVQELRTREVEVEVDAVDAVVAAIRTAVFTEHGVPVARVVLVVAGQVPKTSSGKVRRRTCRERLVAGTLKLVYDSDSAAVDVGRPLRAPDDDDDARARIRGLVAKLLGLPESAIADHRALIALGLDSLAAAELRARLGGEANEPALSFEVLLSTATVASLAAAARPPAAPSPALTRPRAATITRRAATAAEARLWLLEQLQPGTQHVPFVIEIEGVVDERRLARAWRDLVAGCPALRTRFIQREGPEGALEAELVEVDAPELARVELVEPDAATRDQRARALIEQTCARVFDTSEAPLIRGLLIRGLEQRSRLLVVVHHLVADGWSVSLLGRSLAHAYRSRPWTIAGISDLAAELVAPTESTRAADLRYWRAELGDADWSIALPRDRGSTPSERGAALRVCTRAPSLGPALARVARSERATPFVVMLAALVSLLHRYSGQAELCVGTVAAQRAAPATHAVVGPLINTIVLRSDCADDPSFATLIGRLKATVIAGFEHAALPFDEVVRALAPGSGGGRSPFQVMFVYQNFPLEPLEVEGARWSVTEPEVPLVPFDLTLAIRPEGDVLSVSLDVDAAMFSRASASRILRDYLRVLEAALTDPSRPLSALGPWDAAEAGPIEAHALVGATDPAFVPIHRSIAAVAARDPSRPAILGPRSWTFAELARAADALASRLRAHELGPGALVGVHVSDRASALVAILGVLEAGAAYLPLDPELPAARLGTLLDDAQPELVVSDRPVSELTVHGRAALTLDFDAWLAGPARSRGPSVDVDPEQPAYVLYTSGTTAAPVGVVVSHRALAYHARALASCFELGPDDRVLQFASLAFDVSAEELFPTWSRGAAVVVVTDSNPRALTRALADLAVTVLNLPSRYWELWFQECSEEVLPSLRLLITGSEPVSAERLAEFHRRLPDVRCVHAYGLTECTITSLIHELGGDPDPAEIPIGRPIPGTSAWVLDAGGHALGPGGRGELYLGGPGLAQGYLGRPAATAALFVPSPFGPPGARLYRTGDLVQRLWTDELAYRGRDDLRLSVRGYRIDPAEIEAQLRVAGAVDAVVVADEERLVAHLEAPAERVADIRSQVAAQLPAYMRPSVWVAVDALPRLANGKIDRRRLAAAGLDSRDDPGEAPIGPLERTVAEIFAELLSPDEPARIDRDTHFFAAGGHSLLALQAIARIEVRLGVTLGLRALFDAPTVRGVAETLAQARPEPDPTTMAPTIKSPASPGPAPLTAAQQRLAFIEGLRGDSAEYNMPLAVRGRGPVDGERLGRAFAALVARHDALHSVIVDGHNHEGPQASLVIRSLDEWPRVETRALELARQPFELERGPLIRAELLHGDDDRWMLVVVVHHIVCDGRSLRVMLDELGELYRGDCPLSAQPGRYADYARSEAARSYELGLAFWRSELAGSEPVWLPTLGSTATGEAGRVNARVPVTRAELERLARRAGATVHMVLIALTQVMLARWSGDSDVRVATPVANRPGTEHNGVVGCFVNTVILRATVGERTPFASFLDQLRNIALAAYEHQATPFDQVVAALAPARGSGTPLIELMLLLECGEMELALGEEISTEVHELDTGAAKFDLTLTVRLRERRVEAELEYDRGRFEHATVESMLASFAELAQSVVREPEGECGALRMLDEDGEAQVEAWESGGPVEAGAEVQTTLHDWVEAQARATPDAVAVECGARTLRYRQLDARANQVARGLRRLGLGAGARVGLRMDRSEDLIVAMFGVLKAGAAYVPIDPEYPVERQRYIEDHSRVERTLSGIGAFAREDPSPVSVEVEPEQLAYVIYTSGSEGRPKGVGIPHRAAAAMVAWARATYGPSRLARVLASTSVCFDLSVFEIFAPLAVGGAVILVESIEAIAEAEDPTLVNTVPSAIAHLLGRLPASVRTVNLAGEVLPRSVVEALHDRGVSEVWNLYGPSEDTTYSTAARIARDDPRSPSIGRALPGTTTRILDPHMQRVPPGARGELYLGGVGLARGYVERPARSATQFVPDPFARDGQRLYRTGDWARHRPDGELEFLGRRDHQVKVRGYRIELGEVEEGLRRAGALEAVAVVGRGDHLIAHVELDSSATDGLVGLRARVAELLPRYLIPTRWGEVVRWPRTSSGKIDRRALPEPARHEAVGAAPEGPVEQRVAAIYAEVLGLELVSRETDFFDAGGHSLLAIQLAELVRRAFGVPVPVRALFDGPTVHELAAVISSLGAHEPDQPPSAAPAIARGEGRDWPVTAAQRRLWFVEQLARGRSHNHVPMAIELRGPLDVDALRRSFELLVTRHEGLRTCFVAIDGVPHQRLIDVPLPFELVEIGPDEVEARAAVEVERPFDLEAGPLFRLTVLRTSPDAALWVIVMHHLICDEWSLGVLLREFAALYPALRSGAPAPTLPALPTQLIDLALARAEASEAEVREWDAQRRYWTEQLREVELVPVPGSATLVSRGAALGRYRDFAIPAAIVERIDALARAARATQSMVLLAVYAACLTRHTGARDLAIGMPTASRSAATEGLVGFFVNELVVRIDCDSSLGFGQLLARTRALVLAALDNQALPFDEVVAAVRRAGDPQTPLVNVQFDAHNAPFGPLEIADLQLAPRTLARATVPFDLQLSVEDTPGGIAGFVGWNRERISEDWALRFIADFVRLAELATIDPEAPIAQLFGSGSGSGSGSDDEAEDFVF